MKKTNTTENSAGVSKVAVGAGLAALAAAAAGAYFLYGSKNAPKHRKQVKAWSVKAKGEVLEKLESLKEVNEDVYHKVVDEVSEQYQKVKNLDAADVKEFVSELKSHWSDIAEEIGIAKKEAASEAKEHATSIKKHHTHK